MVSLVDNKNMIISGHMDGKVIRYIKEDNYKSDLFIEEESEIIDL